MHKFFHILSTAGISTMTRPRCCYPDEWEWYSVCSRHRFTDENCPICRHGAWVNKEQNRKERELYEADPDEWRRRANRR